MHRGVREVVRRIQGKRRASCKRGCSTEAMESQSRSQLVDALRVELVSASAQHQTSSNRAEALKVVEVQLHLGRIHASFEATVKDELWGR